MNSAGARLFDPGSFKDPDGGVLSYDNRIYRFFTPQGAARFRSVTESGLLDALASRELVIGTRRVGPEETPGLYEMVPNAADFVEHPRLPFISYCYEWPFGMLKSAAHCHLEIMRGALEKDFVLKDATPYNVQFVGTKPVLIDIASFEPYTQGQPWEAYNEFCRLFLNPLLFEALVGVPFQRWLRGSLNGIAPVELSKLLPLRHKLRPSVFPHVVLQAWLERSLNTVSTNVASIQSRIPKAQISKLVRKVEGVVNSVKPSQTRSSWVRYDEENTYSREAVRRKEMFVEDFFKAARPKMVWDLGCNTGHYSVIAARHSGYVVAMDSDANTVNSLYERLKDTQVNILPLVVDLLDPSPGRGWAQKERRGLAERGPADSILCLALIHHLSITGNVPLKSVFSWLATITMNGVVEFVPKDDPGAQSLLRLRRDVYEHYSLETFEKSLRDHFQVINKCTLPDSGRILYSFAKAP